MAGRDVPQRTRRPSRAPGAARGLAALVLICTVLSATLTGLVAAETTGKAAAPGSRADVARPRPGNLDTVEPPSVTVTSPDTAGCQARTAPSAADDTSEAVPSGQQAPQPQPVPKPVVGGARLGGCSFVLPQGSPPLPSDISAAAWLIADLDSGDVLAAKDPHGRYRPASTLKLLTMTVLLRTLKDPERVVIGEDEDAAQEGTRVGIGADGKYTVRQLMTFLMLGSGNDVANALARANGGTARTVAQMNQAAGAMGALDTRAATVTGLDGPGQQTSAYDLALIARSNMASKLFAEIVRTQYAQVPGFGDYAGFSIANDNQLLFNYPGALGGKTGFTDAAGNTFVGMAERGGRRLVVTMLAGTQQPRPQWMQAASLLDWGFALPVETTPVGRLVRSAAEATGQTATPTLAPPTTPPTQIIGGQISHAPAVPTATTSSGPPATAAPPERSGGGSVFLWAGGALLALLALAAALLGLRGGPAVRDEPGDPAADEK